MAPYALHTSFRNPHPPFLIRYDAHNAEYLLQRRAFTTDLPHLKRLPKAAYSLLQWLRLRRMERDLCLRSDHVMSVSQADVHALSRLSPRIEERITVLPNGVDPLHWSREAVQPASEIPPGTPSLVFDGSMDYRPNRDATLC